MLVYRLVRWKCILPQNEVAKDQQKGSVAIQRLIMKYLMFAHLMIADITSELKIVPSQKLCLAYFTCYTVMLEAIQV